MLLKPKLTADADVLKERLDEKHHKEKKREDISPTSVKAVEDRRNSLAETVISDGPTLAPSLLVIKVGTSSLMDPCNHTVSLSHLGRFVDTVCNLKRMGYHVVIVSSGAVGVGCVHLKLAERPKTLAKKQAVAAVGQCRLMRIYEDLFSIRENVTAQVLITRTDLVDRTRFLNFKSCLLDLLALGVTPIINENDSVATEFLRFGDNDTLAAYCAVSISANWLILLTDVHCLYTANPRVDPKAKAISFVARVSEAERLLDTRTNAGTAWGSGGMETKIVSAKIATAAGIHTALAHGQYPERILDILHFAETNTANHEEEVPNPLAREEGVFPSKPLQGDFLGDKRFAASSAAACAAAAGGDPSSIDTFYSTINEAAHVGAHSGSNHLDPDHIANPLGGGLHPSPSRADLIQTAADELLTTQHQLEMQLEIVQKIEAELDTELTATSTLPSTAGDHSCTASESPYGEEEHEELTNATLKARGIVAVDPVGAWQDKLPYVGTIFVGQDCTQSIRDQRRWILSLPVRGKLYVDEGCCTSVILEKKSLFAAGIKKLEGDFIEGDVVAICQLKYLPEDVKCAGGATGCRINARASHMDSSPSTNSPINNLFDSYHTDEFTPQSERDSNTTTPTTNTRVHTFSHPHPMHNQTDLIVQAVEDRHTNLEDVVGVNACPNELARCIVNFPSTELEKIKGLRSSEFHSVLGYDCDPEVAHRSNIIFLDTTVYTEEEETIGC